MLKKKKNKPPEDGGMIKTVKYFYVCTYMHIIMIKCGLLLNARIIIMYVGK